MWQETQSLSEEVELSLIQFSEISENLKKKN